MPLRSDRRNIRASGGDLSGFLCADPEALAHVRGRTRPTGCRAQKERASSGLKGELDMTRISMIAAVALMALSGVLRASAGYVLYEEDFDAPVTPPWKPTTQVAITLTPPRPATRHPLIELSCMTTRASTAPSRCNGAGVRSRYRLMCASIQ